MANQFGGNPWVFDTAFSAGEIVQHDIKAAHFEWTGYAEGDELTVADSFGKVVWAATGPADLDLINSFTIEWLYGLNVTKIDGGTLRLYFK